MNRSSPWPAQTRDVPRIDPVPHEEFERRFVKPEVPVIVRAVPPAIEAVADPDLLCSTYGAVSVKVLLDIPDNFLTEMARESVREMTLQEFGDHLRSPTRTRPCYANQLSIDSFPTLKEATRLDAVAEGMQPTFVWFGSKDSNIGLHFDPADGYLLQLWGKKAFYLFPSEMSGSLYPLPTDATRSQLDLRTLDETRFPKLQTVVPYAGELGPGELLFVPKYCWHYYWARTDSVSASMFQENDFSAARIAGILKMYGPRYCLGIARQAVWHGLLGKPYELPAYGWPPTGFLLWTLIAHTLRAQGRALFGRRTVDPPAMAE